MTRTPAEKKLLRLNKLLALMHFRGVPAWMTDRLEESIRELEQQILTEVSDGD